VWRDVHRESAEIIGRGELTPVLRRIDPITAERPTAPRSTTSTGVKQHNAATAMPKMPTLSKPFTVILLP
jgi:hypothetical protein